MSDYKLIVSALGSIPSPSLEGLVRMTLRIYLGPGVKDIVIHHDETQLRVIEWFQTEGPDAVIAIKEPESSSTLYVQKRYVISMELRKNSQA